ncbi:hypothetical protein ACLBNB_06240 [Pseudomonas chlororaphis subsp. aurantiaca]|uniref:hypothetical protein n=1 Tax=Pseudomonas chlororaphis TaxID=587753 RepID=UPI000F565B86|nr:hypothetical protein [Pseudomonas chlororaphis]AZD52912.1 hypothetical protein C4K19_1106 [Pseudomonas chlororaphis subsp. aurantiaca]AZD59009.1 hypothetical protein C4K18_1017 [Pseudomonas chlororaphis subsp. aurantiaca]
MMTEQFWHSWLAFALLLGPILLAATSLAFSYYLSQRYLREMLEAFQRSRYFHRWTDRLQYLGWFEHFLMFGRVRGMMLCPGPGLRKGLLSPEDVHNFPPRLKRLLTIQNRLDGILFVWSAIMYALLKLTG